MKSSPSSTSKLNWQSQIIELLKKGQRPAYIGKLNEANIVTIYDLIWTFPLRVQKTPKNEPFMNAQPGNLFRGSGKVLNVKSRPQFGRKGKGRILLYAIDCIVQDSLSDSIINLKWFNAYPNQVKSLSSKEEIEFQGEVTEFQNQNQIINPKIISAGELTSSNEILREYPTVNGVSGIYIKGLIDKIPASLWNDLSEDISEELILKNGFLKIGQCFQAIHGISEFQPDLIEKAKERLIYEEFYREQVKFKARRESIKKGNSPKLNFKIQDIENYKKLFPYELTADQLGSFQNIIEDMLSGHPMMRMIQGDVGCGKTTVAFLAACLVASNQKQVAVMAPTEALTIQHFKNFEKLFKETDIHFEILLGSHSQKYKKEVYRRLEIGAIDIIIGTHSLFQENVKFKDLALAVIDEQHKFGVEQRLKLVKKGEGTHTLIMSATPIPRTLSLTHYGDLDISIIKKMPLGKKEVKTRLVEPDLMNKYLSFVKTRIELGEQAYVIAPAIEESETLDISNVNAIKQRYEEFFPHIPIGLLHGKLKSYEKDEALEKFEKNEIKILVSTSVVEVGIDVHNATVMAIYIPERFGLSSLHQLRGRVGRGGKPGFCFLINEKPIGFESKQRLKVIESSNDGFRIAEADLEQRGHGDLFGKEQSGIAGQKRLANIIKHEHILYEVCKDIELLMQNKDPQYINLLDQYKNDYKVSSTI